jgi:hemerythrin-like domain-containing protein
MENNVRPIKRSQQLAPLSREHHDGLLFAWKLQQGLNNATSVEVLKDYCLWYYKEHLRQHFHEEEEILLKYISADDKLAIQLKAEHDNIRELILSIGHKPDTITIGMLADFINRHIRFEERVLFGYVEKTLSPAQLDEIFKQLENDPACSSEWKDEFWVKKAKRGDE